MEADYVVVGGGTAGCVIAARLAAPGRSVVLLEAGDERDNPYTRIPAGALHLVGSPAYDSPIASEPDPTAHGRRTIWSAARVLGGGSLISGMVYARGWAADYDEWAAGGARGWSWAEVAPWFERLERWHGGPAPRPGRGDAGPVYVAHARSPLPLAELFLAACEQSGLARLSDVNAPRPDGAGLAQVTMREGRRWSAADAYLGERRRDPHLTILTRTRALKLPLNASGNRCIGVYARRNGRELQVRARREVILACGTFGSPRLLQLSGIGAPGLLQSAGVKLVHELPGVGANLSDQVGVQATLAVATRTVSRRDQAPWRALGAFARWATSGGGVLASPIVLATACVRSTEGLADPDLQVQFTGCAFEGGDAGPLRLRREYAVTTSVNVRRPRARGRVRITSPDPDAPLRVEHLSLIDAGEVAKLVTGLRWLRRLYAAPAFAAVARDELAPGPALQSGAELEEYVRRSSFTQYHPVGTCRMGATDDPDAVVDPRLCVQGMKGLRVADASVMPFVPSANAGGPTLMIAERAARFVVEDEGGG
ncbi:MAG: GMC family oxidoreductase [Pseudomonadota bacterium]